jgi:hypothetical protein
MRSVRPTYGIVEGDEMASERPDDSCKDFGPVTAVVRALFVIAKHLSPMEWLGSVGQSRGSQSRFYLLRARSVLSLDEITSEVFTRRRAHAIETYMVYWLVLQVVLVGMVCLGSWPRWLGAGLAVIATLRIIEIVQVTVNTTLFDALSGRPDQWVASRSRMIVLAGVNFIELALCFGVVYAADLSMLKGAGRPIAAFYFSIITQLTIGYGDVCPVGWLRLVAAAHGLIGILFVILVFGRFIAALPPVQDKFGSRSQ